MKVYSAFSFLTKDEEEQRNLLYFGLSMLLAPLATSLYAVSLGQAFYAKYGITPAITATMMIPSRIIGITVTLCSAAFIDRVRNRIAFNAITIMAGALSCFAILLKCLGPDSFRTVAGIVTIDVIFSIPGSIFAALRGGADAMVQCRVIHNEIRGRFWSIFGMAGGIGGILTGLFSTALLRRMDVRQVWVITTIPGMALLILSGICAWKVRELKDLQNERPPRRESVLNGIKKIVTMKSFRIMMPANFMRSMGDGCVGFALLLAFQSWRNPLPQVYAGYSQIVTSVAPFLGYGLLWLVLDRFGPGIVLPVVDIIMGASMFCMGSVQNGYCLIACIAVYQTLLITEGSAIPLAHYEVVPNEVMGAFNNVRLLLMTLTGGISGTLAGIALGYFSPPAVFAVGAIIKVSAGFLYSYGIYSLRRHVAKPSAA